jgi:AraC family transcriptional regulator
MDTFNSMKTLRQGGDSGSFMAAVELSDMSTTSSNPELLASPCTQNPASLVRRLGSLRHLLQLAIEALPEDDCGAKAALLRAATLLNDLECAGAMLPVALVRTTRGGLAQWQLKRVLRFVERNLQSHVHTRALAREAGLSTSHFCHAFRASMARSPYAYIVERRIERAKDLMLSTRQSLSDIALECGLADQAHLSRLFKRQTGFSPAAWRRHRQTDSLCETQ